MRIQIIVRDEVLVEYYNIHLWSIREVIKYEDKRHNPKTKPNYIVRFYFIWGIEQKTNNKGQKAMLKIKDNECKEIK